MQEDAREIQQGKPYHWKDWSIIRGRDCLYIWSDAAALELSNGSNGWFRFILDGKLATMYSSGSPEGGSDSSGTGARRRRAPCVASRPARLRVASPKMGAWSPASRPRGRL